jgi:hypothetical protein
MLLLPMLIVFLGAIAVLIASVTISEDRLIARQRPWFRVERAITWLAVGLAAVAAVGLLLVPTYAGVSEISSANLPSQQAPQPRSATLLSVNGVGVLPFLFSPVVFAAIPLIRATPHQRRVRAAIVAVVLVGFTILGSFSIGFFYVPSALATLATAILGVLVERTA